LRNKYVIPLKDVKEIKKKKTLGLFNNSIDIKVFDEQTKRTNIYTFTSFSSRNVAYKRIKMVYKNFQRTNQHDKDNNKTMIDSDSDNDSGDNTSHLNKSIFSESGNGMEEGEGHAEYFPAIDPEKVYEVGKVIFKMTPQAFFDTFFRETENSHLKFQGRVMEQFDTTVSEWRELDQEPGVFVREITGGVKVKDVPFISEAKFNRAQKYKKEGDKLFLNSSITNIGIPYASYFIIEDQWEIVPYQEDKCVIRVTAFVNFVKSTFWKNKIETKTKESYKKEMELWLEDVTAKGFNYEIFNTKKMNLVKEEEEILLHGIQKEVNFDDLSSYQQILYRVKKFIIDYYNTNPRDFFLIIGWCVGLLMMLMILRKLSRIENMILDQNRQCTSHINI
jgi:hypothetical protein